MKQPLNLKNSIYQQKSAGNSYSGLTVSDGMLINNRPDGQTGIAQMSQSRKLIRIREKISIVAQGNAMGEMMGEMGGCCD